jgi:hypothetical protein
MATYIMAQHKHSKEYFLLLFFFKKKRQINNVENKKGRAVREMEKLEDKKGDRVSQHSKAFILNLILLL